MKIEDALITKKSELEELQSDIDKLEYQAAQLKEVVKKYNELKSQAANLKKARRIKQKDFDTVTQFLSNIDDNYLTKIYPLFANQAQEASI